MTRKQRAALGPMHEGRVDQVGTPRELLNNPADDFVRHLVETPKRRARLLAGLMRKPET